jgi:hypothetical protein
VVLEKDGEYKLDRYGEKCGSMAWRQGGKKHLSCNIRKGNWIGQILHSNFLLKHVTEEKIEERGRRGRKRKQLLDDFMEKRRYWNLEEEALDCSL